MFGIFYKLGVFHIINIEAYDHILFVTMLVAVYRIKQWKQVLALVTAFTIGHSISLALATFDIMSLPSDLVEFLIAVTIFLTGLENLLFKVPQGDNIFSLSYWIKYGIAMFFGLIHGLGFSTTLKNILLDSSSVITPLLGFNLGVETGQIIVVFVVLILIFLLTNVLKIKHKYIMWTLSVIGIIISILLMYYRGIEIL